MEQVRASVEEAVNIIKNGGMVILTDDETRENEGDLVVASEFITAEQINFMAKYGKGLICVSLPAERCDELQLNMMVQDNTSKFGTAFTVSVEAREGVTTGISAHDRAVTIKTLINPSSTFRDIVIPGHMFPLRAKKGGVLVRPGQTEGSYDLARMAGLYPSGVICEIMDDDGSMARMPRLIKFAKEHNIKIVTIADLIKYRLETEQVVKEIETALMPSAYGDFKIKGFLNTSDENEAVAIINDIAQGKLDEKRLEKAKNRLKSKNIFDEENVSSLAQNIGYAYVLDFKDYHLNYEKGIDAVTLTDVAEAAKRMTSGPMYFGITSNN